MIFRSKYHIGKVSRLTSQSIGAAHQARRKRWYWLRSGLKKLFLAGLVLGTIGAIALSILIYTLSKQLPDVTSISTYIPSETTKIYSADGVVLAELHKEENRILIPLEKISPIIRETVVAVEDTDFYEHHGLNFKGIARAAFRNIRAGGIVEGASTITQQLARNVFLSLRQKFKRKLAEAILAVELERNYTKDEILELYLNQVYWGHNSYGIESASQLYFGKHASDISLAESAMLVGLLKGPELFSPYRNMTLAKQRQKVVLTRMEKLGVITHEESIAAYEEELVLKGRKKLRYKAPYFSEFIVKQLKEMYGEEMVYTSGMKVYTTLNYDWQQKAEEVVETWYEYGQKPFTLQGKKYANLNYEQLAMLALEPSTGYIKVMQGGREFLDNQFNRTTQANRQPGSAFKPYVYLAGLDKGFSPGTIFQDSPVTFNTVEGPYSPLNYDLKYRGNISLRVALQKSVNVISIKLNDLVGPKNVVNVARQMEIHSPLKPILSLPLGANEVTMLELASSYGIMANAGRYVEPTGIIRIEDREGAILYEHQLREKQAFNPNKIAALVEMMRDVVRYGTGRNANLPRPIAGKTGTTSDYKDAWFVGYVPQLVCAAWVGNDDNTPMNKVTGGWVPALMWRDLMKHALARIPAQNFPAPKGMVKRMVNWETGLLANEFSPKESVHEEKYWKGSEPTEYDSYNPNSQSSSSNTDSDDEPVLDFFRL